MKNGNVKIKFGRFVRDKRLDANLSIQQLSEMTKLSRVTLSLIENGHTLGGRLAMNKIANALGLTYLDLREQVKMIEREENQ